MAERTAFFDYELPKRLVAQEPLRRRADARLMVVNRHGQQVMHHHVRDLPLLLTGGDRLVLNNTRVIPAHLAGRRTITGGRWQGLFINSTAEGDWRILCKTRGRLEAGETITLIDREGRPRGEKLRLINRLEEGQWLAHVESHESTAEILERLGRVPLPPYIRGGNMVDDDVANYQTVFAEKPGAIAAPTAGLHFTNDLLRQLAARGVPNSRVTLHVGRATFRPIESVRIEEHQMHSERGEITPQTAVELNETHQAGGRLIAIGTTVTRLLETAVCSPDVPAGTRIIPPWHGSTDLFIRPPFEFRAIDALMTNFHFPRTTLLLLVEAFAGRELIEHAYQEAIREEYRFYSYGDAMLIV